MFLKGKIKRFYEVSTCAPPPGTYDPKSPGPKTLKGAVFDKAERFKEPAAPKAIPKTVKVHSTYKIPSNFSSQSSINTECSKKSTKTIDSISTKNSSKKIKPKPQDKKKLDSTITKELVNIKQLGNNTKTATDTCTEYINSCRSAYLESMENRACQIVIESSQAALYAVCQRLLDTCTHNEILQNENARLQKEICEKKSFEQLAAEEIAIVEHALIDKVNNYADISEKVKENYLAKMRFIMITLDELESMVDGEVKEIIQKLKLDLEMTDPEGQNYKQLLEKYEKLVKENVQLEEIAKKQDDLEKKIINLTNEKNALAAKLQNSKPKSTNILKNRLDALATPRRRADIENIAPKDKTYILKSKTVNVKPIAQSSPLREMNR